MPNARKTHSYVDEWRRMWEPDLGAIGGFNGATCDPTQVDPKVLDWIKEHRGDQPHFVKVINRNAAHGQPGLLARSSGCMVVPAPFVEKNFRNLQRVITLERNDQGPGRKWKVAFGTVSKHPIWHQGWRNFARDNDLKPRDVVVFELVENSHFRFTHFDEEGNVTGHTSTNFSTHNQGVRRELSFSSQSLQPTSSASESDHERPSPGEIARNRVILSDSEADSPEDQIILVPKTELVSCPGPATPQKRRRLCKLSKATPGHTSDCEGSGVESGHRTMSSPSDSFNPLAFTISSKRRPVTQAERQRAKDIAETHTHVTTSPHFLVVMSAAHVYQRFQLMLPDQFVRESGFPPTGCRMTLEDSEGRAWEVHSRENVTFQVGLIRKGWALFALEHRLEEGDVCVFELAEREARSILVHIFRVVEVPEGGGNDVALHDHYELHGKAT